MSQFTVQICMFVYNLENELEKSIKSTCNASAGLDYKLYVMCNGCRDNSYEVAQDCAKKNSRILPINITKGDKADTWNKFVYDIFDDHSIPVFIDGDLTFQGDAIKHIVDYYIDNPNLNAVSGFPWSGGRSAEKWQKSLIENHEFTGNLNVLAPHFIQSVKRKKVKLPIGLIGEDSMLGFLTATNLADGSDAPASRIGVCQEAIFIYPRLNVLSISDIRLYLRRRVRYAMRSLQQNAIVPKLKKDGITAMPKYASTAFKPNELRLKWRGIDTVFLFFAIKKIKQNIPK